MSDRSEKLSRLAYQAASLAAVMTAAFGEFESEERGGDARASCCLNHIAGLLDRAMEVARGSSGADAIPIEAIQEIDWAHATANILNDMAEATLGGALMSDEIMCNLYSLLADCLWRSHAWINSDGADDDRLFELENKRPRTARPVNAPASPGTGKRHHARVLTEAAPA